MPYNCQLCVRRKVKCDRTVPTCSSCVKSKQKCVYQAPPKPRRRKRRHDETEASSTPEEDLHERLARYEHILRENGLLEVGEDQPPGETMNKAKPGRLVSGDGKSRYIDSTLWLDTGMDDIHELSDDAEGPHDLNLGPSSFMHSYDPVSAALLGISQNLLEFHPSHEHAMKLWQTNVHNVQPLCRILHVPTTTQMVTSISRQPSTATRAQECQLFAIYHFSIYTLSDEDCLRDYSESRSVLLTRYEHALRQALVNASWLKTTEMPIMQAYMLFLICGRSYLDPHTFWMLTGIAVRIAQRMGLHRDAESLGLPPFEVQMRRRLFWQLVPLDGFAGQHSGTGISMPPNTWDVKKPLNLDDDQIYPGMTQQPEEVKGATDMIYVLMRVELSNFYSRKALRWKSGGAGPSVHLRTSGDGIELVDQVEAAIEDKILRYCDVINPLHYLVMLIVRSAANIVRLRIHMTPLMNSHAISDARRRKLYELAQRILDVDNAVYRHPQLQCWRWQVKEFFLWDALICILTSLAKPGFFSRTELDAAWAKVGETLTNHPEITGSRRPVYSAAWKALIEAWEANPPSNSDPEPKYIIELKLNRSKVKRVPTSQTRDVTSGRSDIEAVAPLDSTISNWNEASLDTFSGYSPGVADWVFWDQFFQNAVANRD
ncbi:C6 transcription factor domain protein [Cryphonectria parasitica EP155]|uniref:C6 transcription factor domain protein n=1 Tax=Cryphonectria parasitica (strain ATCC 38755 / EP155) TaxID=660469 RepID=A0A9P4XWB7_CRYP1|nr:C6 transcription factor domain protein [Cryphonectria parasitica EP155]KAF3762012.1 C6 transcription factor domain protein [Cryphonectria parasitica EP155]